MKVIAIVFGGNSVEHDISILTGLHAARHVPHGMRAILVYLTRDGRFLTSGRRGVLSKIDNYIAGVSRASECFFSGGRIYKKCGIRRSRKIDAVLNCCHGGPGEDGRLAGMLEILGVPVTSCDSRAAATLQSKSRTREVLTSNGFAQPPYMNVGGGERIKFPSFMEGWRADRRDGVVVKPDTLGSSIGITVVRDEGQFESALELAFSLDDSAIAEKYLESADEINCSAFRYGNTLMVSACEVIRRDGEVFDYDSKYLDAASGFVHAAPKKSGRDENSHPKEQEIRELTKKAYQLFDCKGVVRVDFLVVGDAVYLNEINTVPGFLSYHLWQKAGLPYATLIEMLVRQAQKDAETGKKTVFQSEILQKNRNLVD